MVTQQAIEDIRAAVRLLHEKNDNPHCLALVEAALNLASTLNLSVAMLSDEIRWFRPAPQSFKSLIPRTWFTFAQAESPERGRGPFQKIGDRGAYMDVGGSYWSAQDHDAPVFKLPVQPEVP